MSKTLEKYIMKIPSINWSYSKKFETLLTSSKMACSDMITRTAKQCFSKLLGIVIKVLNFVWMTYRCTYIITDWLPRDRGPDSSHVSRPQMIIINDYSMKMIKTNQNLLLGWSLSIGKIREKLWTNQQSSLK